MPADSESSPPVTLPRTWRPLGVRLAGGIFGGLLLFVCVFAWISFGAETRSKFTVFQIATLLALGMLAFALGLALVRSRVVAETDRLVVVNGYRRREFEYAEVVGVHLPPGAPWVTLDLADGTTVSAMGIQGSDGARAKQAVRELRAVVNAQSA